ncbi:MAG: energy transducer TonB [Pyrinomonadaceae bacterium]
MGKIVKFCISCDEGFAEKFGFCPNCGQTLTAFELNPVVAAPTPVADTAPLAAAPEIREPEQSEPLISAAEPIAEPVIEEPVKEEPIFEAPVTAAPRRKAAAASAFVQTKPVDADAKSTTIPVTDGAYATRDGFRVHVIEETNVGKRRAFMLGTLGVMMFALMSGLVYNLFSKDLEVGSINDDIFSAVIVDLEPTQVEEEVKQKRDKDGGGGGGGGREEKEETTQGDLADQEPKPTRPPDAKVFRSDNFELVTPPPTTEGDRKFEKKFDRWGDPNGRFASFSNGTGSGGGQGSGVGTGQGSGRGTGAGSGTGSGSGGGLGDGNGNGTGKGSGGDSDFAPPPPRPVGVTQALKIVSKPRPGYTDAARQNNIQGTVILRVTFLGSGQIGSISPVKGLPNGLTEQAIAAARRISFEPAKRDGVGQSVTKQIEYSFSIY